MEKVTLAAEKREERKKQAAKRLRRQGRVPGVVYGGSEPPITVSVDEKALHAGLHAGHGMNTIFDLRVEGMDGGTEVIAKELTRDPLTGRYIHVDFYRIDLSHKMVFSVPLDFQGTPVGVRLGGVLERYLDHVDVRCLATEVPEAIVVPMDDLEIGHSIHVSDLVSGGAEIVTDPTRPVAAVHPPRVATVTAAADVEATEGEAESGAGGGAS